MANVVPQLDRLKSQLLTSGLQEKNQALFQVINQLIDTMRQGMNTLNSSISAVSAASGGSSSGSTTIITSGAIMPRDGEDGSDGLQGIPGPQGLRGPIGPVGPPGIDGNCECWCMPFIGNSITDPLTLAGTFVQRIP
jgi:hypothetical protein